MSTVPDRLSAGPPACVADQFDDPAALDDKPALASFGQHCDRIANPGFHRLCVRFSQPEEWRAAVPQ